jgi:hypothetical protein
MQGTDHEGPLLSNFLHKLFHFLTPKYLPQYPVPKYFSPCSSLSAKEDVSHPYTVASNFVIKLSSYIIGWIREVYSGHLNCHLLTCCMEKPSKLSKLSVMKVYTQLEFELDHFLKSN